MHTCQRAVNTWYYVKYMYAEIKSKLYYQDTDQVIHIPVKWIAIAIITILVAAIACKWVWTDRQMINDANTLADCDTKMKIYKEEMKKYNELKEEYNNLKTKSELKNQQLSTVEGKQNSRYIQSMEIKKI